MAYSINYAVTENNIMKRLVFLLVMFLFMPSMASAWWNEDWGFKKKISLDSQQLKQGNLTAQEDALVLVRLHSGNFLFFNELSEGGKDIRFFAEDESTPLKFYIEKLDIANSMALLWVRLPKSVATSQQPAVWMYFGNAKAADGQDKGGVFAVSQILSYDFSGKTVSDGTANANQASQSTATLTDGGLIGGMASFQGSQLVQIADKPTLSMTAATGWTVSMWTKIDQDQKNAVLFQRNGAASGVTLSLNGQVPTIEVTDSSGAKSSIVSQAGITPGSWHHLAISATADAMTMYVDGSPVGQGKVKLADLGGDIALGADLTSQRGLVGSIDQVEIYKIPRSENQVKFDYLVQGQSSQMLTYDDELTPGDDEAGEEGDESYLLSTLNNVTIDGWVIIAILGVMCFISWLVMILKAISLNRNNRENQKFERAFRKLDAQDIAGLDEAGDEEDDDGLPALFSLSEEQGTYKGSSLFKIYHVGVEEMNKRFLKAAGAETSSPQTLSSTSMEAVKAAMHVVVVRELQKLNSLMVFLTIAISGGPFLGLLGTVVGVMITFASIAASGEINVNAIAPGIAAALVATVAGLFVAIPALFGYNYLGSKIKVISADMQVFVDEFVAKLAEQHT